MKPAVVAIGLVASVFASCATWRGAADEDAGAGPKSRIIYVGVTRTSAYVIDPVAQNCFFLHSSPSAESIVPVPCESLLKDPNSAQHLSWLKAKAEAAQ